MTALLDIIRAEIAATGPMSTARYMELCLAHPKHGYYMTRDPLGAAGDFTTAPEVSQMFGEMLGIWVAEAWTALGAVPFRLIELGPGRGTLMADMVRVLTRMGADPDVWMVETSPTLRDAQATRVPGARWADRLEAVPQTPNLPEIIVANEFFDALPVVQHLRTPKGWCEHQVGAKDGRLVWGLGPPNPSRLTPGDWSETSPVANGVSSEIRRRIDQGGAALIIDYGYTASDRPSGLTLQAVRGHRRADPLDAPGEADLTWLVDFDHLACVLGPGAEIMPQGAFLAAKGIGQRAEALARAAPDRADEIAGQLDRLTATDQMGTVFKTLSRIVPGSV